jgi:hypothetical protein
MIKKYILENSGYLNRKKSKASPSGEKVLNK